MYLTFNIQHIIQEKPISITFNFNRIREFQSIAGLQYKIPASLQSLPSITPYTATQKHAIPIPIPTWTAEVQIISHPH